MRLAKLPFTCRRVGATVVLLGIGSACGVATDPRLKQHDGGPGVDIDQRAPGDPASPPSDLPCVDPGAAHSEGDPPADPGTGGSDPVVGDGMGMSDGGDGYAPQLGDPAGGADILGGEEVGDVGPGSAADPTPPPIVSRCYFQTTPSSSPTELAGGEPRCIGRTSVLTLEGAAEAPWRITSVDAAGGSLPLVPLSGPGSLVAAYLGGGKYSREGYAEVTGQDLSPAAAALVIDINGSAWALTNTCAAPLLHVWVYAAGVAGPREELASGATVCAGADPWMLAFEVPLASTYDVTVFDYGAVSVAYYDEQTAPQTAEGLVVVPLVPVSGRVAFALLDLNGQEVENASVYLDCQ